ncbi:putative invertase inhibitor [Rhodamnia argentea]|uniref:Invertase inhibitor n=1 Tax=Rhodamnia argentea TaxID=178133 RepID=A0A8B8PGD1_9MYRT|nr:putative invertase inhibitor [Rhodamnia argentea]
MKSFLPLVALTFLLLHLAQANDRDSDIIHGSCRRAADGDPNISYGFCIACFEANPTSQPASIGDLALMSINLTISNATEISSCISKLLQNERLSHFARDCLTACSELYSDACSTLRGVVDDFGSRDYYKANVDVSAVMDAAVTCEDGFKEREGLVSPLTKENDIFFQMNAISLAFIAMLHCN